MGAIYLGHKALLEESGGVRRALGSLIRGHQPPQHFAATLFTRFSGYAPEDWAVRSWDGKVITLAECRGKVVFLNFWATWCGPCVAEMAGIEKLSASLNGEPVSFLLVTDEDEQTVRDFLRKRPFRVPVYFRSGRLPDVFQAPGIPATFLLDGQGAVVFRHFGAADWGEESPREFVRGLVKR